MWVTWLAAPQMAEYTETLQEFRHSLLSRPRFAEVKKRHSVAPLIATRVLVLEMIHTILKKKKKKVETSPVDFLSCQLVGVGSWTPRPQEQQHIPEPVLPRLELLPTTWSAKIRLSKRLIYAIGRKPHLGCEVMHNRNQSSDPLEFLRFLSAHIWSVYMSVVSTAVDARCVAVVCFELALIFLDSLLLSLLWKQSTAGWHQSLCQSWKVCCRDILYVFYVSRVKKRFCNRNTMETGTNDRK